MAFWSGEKLIQRVERSGIVYPHSRDKIDCSAYTLSLGPEYFVSPDYTVPFQEIRKKWLKPASTEKVGEAWAKVPAEGMVIPPGQFAYLLTEEFVKIPHDAMGFISLKFGVKGPGLINVSGFHVDPGYHGRLVFSVYNAGPEPTRLQRGQKVFLLWLADLDQESAYVKSPNEEPRENISEDLISKVDHPVHSLQHLSEKIEKLDNELKLFKRIFGITATIVATGISLAALIFTILRFYGVDVAANSS